MAQSKQINSDLFCNIVIGMTVYQISGNTYHNSLD